MIIARKTSKTSKPRWPKSEIQCSCAWVKKEAFSSILGVVIDSSKTIHWETFDLQRSHTFDAQVSIQRLNTLAKEVLA